MKITFTNKETYLQWVAEWKAQYGQLSALIRDLKFGRRYQDIERNRPGAAPEAARYEKLAKAHGNQYGWFVHGQLTAAKAKATELLETRKAAKEEAQRQYLAAVQTRSVACGAGASK